MNTYLKELETLVNIDSGSKDIPGIRRVSDYFAEKYRALGFTVTDLHANLPDSAPLLEIRNKPDCDGIDFLFVGHMDTVFPTGTAGERPFSRDETCAYGPGSADMKSGLLSILRTVSELPAELIEKHSLCILHNGDEEISSIGSKERISELAEKSRYAFVFEPGRSNGDMVLRRKGLAKYFINIKGVAAHAGVEPQKGRSAVHELALWITELTKYTDYEIGTTVNIGVIGGGTAANVVAESANAQVDLRYENPQEILKFESAIEQLKNNPFIDGVTVLVERKGHRPPMNPNEKTFALWETLKSEGENLGLNLGWASTGGGSDANFISATGCPVADAVGPIGGGTHGINEYILLESILPRIKLMVNTVKKLAEK